MPVRLKPLIKLKLPKVLIFSFCVGLVLLYGCSTTNHSPIATQSYHDITSHYNAYFNTNDKVTSILAIAETTHKDKFDSVIPVYYYSSPKEFASNSSDLDDVIKRSTAAIQIHPTANWTDDHFLIIGEAYYLKGEYDKAANSFKYITTQFKNGVDYVKVMKSLHKKVGKYVPGKPNTVKPQVKTIVNPDGTKTLEKVDNRPENSLWIHTPARSEALVWLIKTYTRQNKFDQAAAIVTYVRSDNNFYKNYDPDLDLAEADVKVSKKDYAGAIDPLEKYLARDKVKKKKRLMVRPLFVLAQCYQMTGNSSKAIENYKLVLKSHPDYDMEFYAKLKMAKLAQGSSNNNAEILALLSKMSKQSKYRDYWDQVYYELALISLSEKNRDLGRKYLHKSIASSKSNEQKAIAFLKLAELDYEDEAYVPSKFFYDSTLAFISKNDKQYRSIEERDKVLDNLVKQLNIIAAEDSLQHLASLSKEDLEKAIQAEIARKKKEDEDKKAAAELAKQQALNPLTGSGLPGGINASAASWYFYNTATKAQGYNDFIKKWGNRTLEEDWRRSNKSTSSSTEDELAATTIADSSKKDTVQVVKGSLEEKMLANVPTTPEKMAKSIERMVDAYYNAGTIYKDGLESYGKAQDMFETVNQRFAKHKLLLESYYNLYLIGMKIKNNPMAQKYKDLILAQFPESVIAKVLKDPNYVNQAKMKEKAIDDYFESAYDDYAKNKLDSAWYKIEMSNTLFNPNPLSAKFQLLQALILSKQNRLGDYVQALNSIINKGTDVAIKKSATDLLSLLNKSKLPQVDLSKDTTRRDSLNALYGAMMQAPVAINASRPDTAELTMLQKMEQAKQLAIKSGVLKVDTTPKPVATVAGKDTSAKGATASVAGVKTPDVAPVDTTSPYVRSDDAVHYFVIYIKDPAVAKAAVMSTLAKVNAYNSTQFPEKRLQAKQSLIDAKNQLIAIRQFKSKADAMTYYNSVVTQNQLFNDMKPEQYGLAVISTPNFSTLLSEKNIDVYINKFFNRVYKK